MRRLLLLAAVWLWALPVQAQQTPQPVSYDVFISSNINKGKAGLFFVDARTGLSNIVVTNGGNHSILGKGVLFQENGMKAAKVAYPDGHIESFPAIQLPDPKATVNWVTSANGEHIVWAISQGQEQSILSDLYVADSDGSGKKLLLHTSSTKGIDTIPLAISDNGSSVFYARQGQSADSYQLFPTASDVYGLDVTAGTPTQLPGKTECSCAVAFAANGKLFARLETSDAGGFGVHLWNFAINTDSQIPPLGLADKQAGWMLLSHDGNLLIYTTARGVPPAKGVPPERYAVVLVDIGQHTQRVLIEGLKVNLRPVAFERGNGVVVLAGTDSDGTYKLTLKDGTLLQVSAYTFLGSVAGS
jgi:hypothetical protein